MNSYDDKGIVTQTLDHRAFVLGGIGAAVGSLLPPAASVPMRSPVPLFRNRKRIRP